MATQFITIAQLASQVQRTLAKGNANRDFPYEKREIENIVRNNLHVEAKGEIFTWKGTEGSWHVSESYIATFILDVVSDSDINFGKEYVDIPAAYMSLPYSMGMRSCTPWTNDEKQRKAMIPIPPDAMNVFGQLPAGSLEGLRSYEIDRGRLWFNKNCDRTLLEDEIKQVQVRTVSLDPRAVDRNEQLFYPPEYRQAAIDKTLAYFGAMLQVPKDVVSNENPNE